MPILPYTSSSNPCPQLLASKVKVYLVCHTTEKAQCSFRLCQLKCILTMHWHPSLSSRRSFPRAIAPGY
jgi:hypothetical protein